MCGRFALYRSSQALSAHFGAPVPAEPFAPRYNIAPRAQILAVRAGPDGTRQLAPLRWGLIPGWARDPRIGDRMINARAETVAEKPGFRAAFRLRRCLIPADGFYEWQATPGGKQPWFIARRDGQPLAFAGLWERWSDPDGGAALESATIIVTQANAALRPLHDRMPVILAPTDYARWLDPRTARPEPLSELLAPAAAEALIAHPVGRRVNRADVDDPGLIAPLSPMEGRP